MYVRLAVREEAEARATFGEEWERYAARTPRFVPRRSQRSPEVLRPHRLRGGARGH